MKFRWYDYLFLAVVVGLLLMHPDVRASEGDWWLDVHVGSKHKGTDVWYDEDTETYHPWQQQNLGLGVTYEKTNHVAFGAGGFINSFDKTSIYGLADVHTDSRRVLFAGLSIGPITGYVGTPTETIVLIQPHVSVVAFKRLKARVGYTPDFFGAEAVTLTISGRF